MGNANQAKDEAQGTGGEKNLAIEELLGIALSEIRQSFDDFCKLTPTEFEGVYKVYVGQREAQYKDDWTRMRMLATIVIQPHVKKRITPQALMPFPWEKRNDTREETKPLTAEECRKRFERVKEKSVAG